MSADDSVPDLERLIRNVIRLAFEIESGPAWIGTLSSSARTSIERAGARAASKRPQEQLRDDFDAVGLPELAALVRSAAFPGFNHVWDTREEALVDLARLVAYRDKNLHAVGPPSSQVSDVEIGAVITRLRVRFEALRRSLMNDAGDWWPYIAAVHSNIADFCFERSTGGALSRVTDLVEGDLVILDAVGVHPNAPAGRLRYRILFGGTAGGSRPANSDWQTHGAFQYVVTRIIRLQAHIQVAEQDDYGAASEMVSFTARVRPLSALANNAP